MDTKGISLIELTIVLAVIAIIGAILMPSFTSTTTRARLRSDVQSARIIQSASELYDIENHTELARNAAEADVSKLETGGYLPKDRTTPQTKSAKWGYDAEKIFKIDITGCSDEVKQVAQSFDKDDPDKALIIGVTLE